jgi:alpha-tubulin suppressor-like RCC1 family protein
LRTDATVDCWGIVDDETMAPPGSFTAITTGNDHSCAIDTSGMVDCWGGNSSGQLGAPPLVFDSIDAGRDHNCGVTEDDEIWCWGEDMSGQSSPP